MAEREAKIITEYVYPPVPYTGFDWCAYLDGSEESGPYGRGETEEAAICNLLELLNLEEEDNDWR